MFPQKRKETINDNPNCYFTEQIKRINQTIINQQKTIDEYEKEQHELYEELDQQSNLINQLKNQLETKEKLLERSREFLIGYEIEATTQLNQKIRQLENTLKEKEGVIDGFTVKNRIMCKCCVLFISLSTLLLGYIFLKDYIKKIKKLKKKINDKQQNISQDF